MWHARPKPCVPPPRPPDPREDTARGPPREPTQDSALGRIQPPREQPGGVDRVPPTPRVYSELLLAISSLEKSQTHCEQLWGQRVTSLGHRCSDTIAWIGLRPRTLRRPRRNELHDPASLRWVKVQTVPLGAQLTAASSPLRKHLEFVPSPGTGGCFLRRCRWRGSAGRERRADGQQTCPRRPGTVLPNPYCRRRLRRGWDPPVRAAGPAGPR